MAKLERAEQVHVLPGDGRDAGDEFHRGGVRGSPFLLMDARQQCRVVVDDGVRDETGAVVPRLLLGFGVDAQFPAVDVRDGAAQPVIRFTAVQGLLDGLTQVDVVDEPEDVGKRLGQAVPISARA